MAAVTFSLPNFLARYPEFAATVNSMNGPLFFAEASLFCDNSDCSPIGDLGIRAVLLNMATAHVAQLAVGSSIQPVSPLVGRISSASEGSVSVQTQMTAQSASAEWFQQTRYGAEYWQATLTYRSATYVPGPVRDMDPYSGGAFYVP